MWYIHIWLINAYMSRLVTKTNKMTVRPAKTQISLGIWSDSSLCAQRVAKDPSFLHADSEDFDQNGRMPRLIWVFAGRTVILSWGGSHIYIYNIYIYICKKMNLPQQVLKNTCILTFNISGVGLFLMKSTFTVTCWYKYSTARGVFNFPPIPVGRLICPLQSLSRLHSNITCNFMIFTVWSPCNPPVFAPKWVESQGAIKF